MPAASKTERPANHTGSVMRGFCSAVEDKSWFYDRDLWRSDLTTFVTSLLDRFSLTMSMSYNSADGVTDGYLLFPYPFFVAVPGFDVRAKKSTHPQFGHPEIHLHKLIESVDLVLPRMVQRFTPALQFIGTKRYEEQVKAELAWCAAGHLDYAPCVYPGFSWHNMHNRGAGDNAMIYPLNQIPRKKESFTVGAR